jgi:hypothetical protein
LRLCGYNSLWSRLWLLADFAEHSTCSAFGSSKFSSIN